MAWAPDYVTSTDFAEYVGQSLDATVVAAAITTASRLVDHWTARQFGQVDEAEQRTYRTRIDYRRRVCVADIDDLMTTDDLVVEADGAVTDDYTLEPPNAAQEGRPWTLIVLPDVVGEVAITARWGWTSIPGPVKQATLLQANRIAARRKSPHGLAGSPDMGTELRFLARLDPDAVVALSGYRRRRAVG